MVALLSIFPNNAAESFSPSIVPFQTFPLSNTFSRFSLNWTKHVKNISKKYRLKLFIKEIKENQFWFFSFDPKMFSFDPGQVLELMPGISGWSLDFRMWGGAAWNNLCGSEENKKGWETDYCQCAVADWSWGQNQHNHRFGSWIEMHYWSVRLMKTFPKQVVSTKCGFVDLLQSERKEASFWSWHWLEPDVRGESRQKVSTASFTVGQCFPRFFLHQILQSWF